MYRNSTTNKSFSYLFFYLILFFQLISINNVFAQLEWNTDTPLWVDGSLNFDFTNVSALSPSRNVNVVTTLGSSTAFAGAATYPIVQPSPSRYSVGSNFNTGDASVNFIKTSITFSQPACDLNFVIYDIDGSGNTSDEVLIEAFNSLNASVPNPVISSTSFNTVTGNVITGTSSGAPANTVTYTSSSSAQCISKIEFTFRKTAISSANPGTQFYDIGDLTSATSGALPVKLTSFNAVSKSEGIELSWNTSEELNFSHFEVLSGQNPRSLEKGGLVYSKGNTEGSFYTFEDLNPKNGQNYYQLKMVDFDGTTQLSKMIAVTYFPENIVEIYPNPFTAADELHIIKGKNISLFGVYDQYGRQTSNAINTLSKGLYQLHFVDKSGNNITKKLIIN